MRVATLTERVHGQVLEVARSCPDGLAVADPTRSLTYGELDTISNALAHRLRALGVGPGVRVGLCHERGAVTVVGALATLKAGGAYVGLDPAYPAARLEYMLRDAAVPVVLAQGRAIGELVPRGTTVIDLDRDLEDGCAEPPADQGTADNVAYVIYTSGSTGEPKGVEVSHGNLLSLVAWHRQAFSVSPGDRASMLASPAFDASVWELWPYLSSGASLHIPDGATATSPEALRSWMVTEAITVAFAGTPLAEALLELDWPSDVALRTLLTGGDHLTRRPTCDAPFELVNNYGVTEATVVSTSGTVAPPPTGAVSPPSIGRPIAGTALYLLDESGQPVPPGEAGELHIGGSGVAIGYLGRPNLTAERFLPDPFAPEAGGRMYRTGDLARRLPDGEIEFLGRLDDQVQIRGHRVELAEVASALRTHPAVHQCVVLAHDVQPGDRRLTAYVVPAGIDAPSRQELRDHLSALLPAPMVPTSFIAIDALPITANGKVDRDALPALGADGGGGEPASATDSPFEVAVTAILEELLAVDRVGRHDDFFELGGHSLMAARLVARLQDLFDVELPLLAIFDHPTVAGIAEQLEAARQGTAERTLEGAVG